MPESGPEYRRLPGRGLRQIGRIPLARTSSRLYLGPDHLLSIDSSGYAEQYRRFYYADIQAILIRKTDLGRTWNFVWSVLALVSGLLALGVGFAAAIVFASVSAASVLSLLINLARGPTCQAHLRTAVHLEEMPSVNRLPIARKVLAAVKPRIEEAQGVLAPEVLAERLAQGATGAAVALPERAGKSVPWAVPSRVPTVTSSYAGGWHRGLFALLLVDGAETALLLFLQHVSVILLASLLTGILSIVAILAVIRQQGSALSRLAKGIVWATLGYLGSNFVLGNVVLVVLSAQEPGIASDQWRYLQLLAEMDPFETPWYLGLLGYSIVTSTCLGLTGLLALRYGQNTGSLAGPAPPASTLPMNRTSP